jgi:hypothetical protein
MTSFLPTKYNCEISTSTKAVVAIDYLNRGGKSRQGEHVSDGILLDE